MSEPHDGSVQVQAAKYKGLPMSALSEQSIVGRDPSLARRVHELDATGDGYVSVADVIASLQRTSRERHLLKWVSIMMIAVFVVMCGAMAGLTYGIITLNKEVKSGEYNALASASTGNTLRTALGALSVDISPPKDASGRRLLDSSQTVPVAVTAETASYVSSANISASLGVVGTLAKSAVLEGCRFAAEGHGSFELQTSVHDPNIADLDQAGVQHISGCTVRSNGNMGLTTTSGSSGIFASVIVDGSEFLVDCPPGSETCNLLVVLPGVNTGSSLSLSGGTGNRRLKVVPLIIMAVAGMAVGAGVSFGVGYGVSAGVDKAEKSGCFPGDALVLTSGGRLTPLSALQSGERVLSMSAARLATYQEVFMWGHRDAGALASFVTIRAGGATLRATPDHFVHLVPAASLKPGQQPTAAQAVTLPAAQAKAGDYIWRLPGWAGSDQAASAAQLVRIDSVATELHSGLYNPYTLGGDIVVDGFAASAHSGLAALDPWLGGGKHTAALYQALFAPLRVMYRLMPGVYRHVDGLYSGPGWQGASMASIVGAAARQLLAGAAVSA